MNVSFKSGLQTFRNTELFVPLCFHFVCLRKCTICTDGGFLLAILRWSALPSHVLWCNKWIMSSRRKWFSSDFRIYSIKNVSLTLTASIFVNVVFFHSFFPGLLVKFSPPPLDGAVQLHWLHLSCQRNPDRLGHRSGASSRFDRWTLCSSGRWSSGEHPGSRTAWFYWRNCFFYSFCPDANSNTFIPAL